MQGESAKFASINNEVLEEMDSKVQITIQLCYANKVMYNVIDRMVIKESCPKLKMLHAVKS